MLTQDQQNRISEIIKSILVKRREKFPSSTVVVRNAPFHDLVLKAFEERLKPYEISTGQLIAISSWFHGLSTSLGTGYEHIAHILSGGYKRSFTKEFTGKISEYQEQEINAIISSLKKNGAPNLELENEKLFSASESGKLTEALGFTIDVFIEQANKIVAVEVKSVRPNSGEGRGEKQKILHGKAVLKRAYPDKAIEFYVGFPFDPTASQATEYNKERFINHLVEFKKFFDPHEILIGPELWNKLSGKAGTMEAILMTVESTVKEFVNKSPLHGHPVVKPATAKKSKT
ncbi:MAG: hypothetical protein A2V79_03420 [Betaproteobacteria bacterium RBG_16_56_24]|nr:MAG: hypothetical protein A2V79_03420 [Betaproteobacteria bacterium RBG_16_56_24]